MSNSQTVCLVSPPNQFLDIALLRLLSIKYRSFTQIMLFEVGFISPNSLNFTRIEKAIFSILNRIIIPSF